MKNKGLIATLIVLGVILVGTFAFEMGQKKVRNQLRLMRAKQR